jgi:hypothetical protein
MESDAFVQRPECFSNMGRAAVTIAWVLTMPSFTDAYLISGDPAVSHGEDFSLHKGTATQAELRFYDSTDPLTP